MTRRLPQTIAWLIFAACVGGAIISGWLFSALPDHYLFVSLPLLIAFPIFPLVGALIVTQRPTNTVGWVFLAAGVGVTITPFSAAYVQLSLLNHTDAQLATGLTDIIGNMMWLVNLALGVMLLYLFPDGRPLSKRWAVAFWALVADLVVVVLAQAVTPGPLESHNRVPNPLGISSLGVLPASIMNAGQSLIFLFILLAIVSLIVRYRRADNAQRQQIKWFVFGSIVMIVVIVGGMMSTDLISSDPNDPLANLVANIAFSLGILALPLGVGIGVLRHKLYDIDSLISRTLLYGSLSAILAALFFGLIAGAQTLIRAFTGQAGQSQLVIVFSTLLIAALAQPLRGSLQRGIDRRFYRGRYDAAHTLQTFGATLRSEVELNDLSAHLIAVVEDTMQPARLSLWLRPNSTSEGLPSAPLALKDSDQ
jgi:hypothetical protein